MPWRPHRQPFEELPPPEPPQQFRWIRIGQEYRYAARPGTGLDQRRGESCTVLVISRIGKAPINCLVEFSDGFRCICSWGVLAQLRERRAV